MTEYPVIRDGNGTIIGIDDSGSGLAAGIVALAARTAAAPATWDAGTETLDAMAAAAAPAGIPGTHALSPLVPASRAFRQATPAVQQHLRLRSGLPHIAITDPRVDRLIAPVVREGIIEAGVHAGAAEKSQGQV